MKREQDLAQGEDAWSAAAEFFEQYGIKGGDRVINFFRANGWSVEVSNRRRSEGMTFIESTGDNPREVIVSGSTHAVTKTNDVGYVAWVWAGRDDFFDTNLREIYAKLERQADEITFDEVTDDNGNLVFTERIQRGDHYVVSTLIVNPDPNAEVEINRRFGKFSPVPAV